MTDFIRKIITNHISKIYTNCDYVIFGTGSSDFEKENMIKEIWEMQIRLLRTDSSKALDLLTNPRFRAAYDFLLLREKLGVNLNKAGDWWTKAQAENGVTKKKFSKQRPKYR